MTHLRQEDRRKHRLSACRKGRHDYGEFEYVGAGIKRQVCGTCGAVSIDLTDTDGPGLTDSEHRDSQTVASDET